MANTESADIEDEASEHQSFDDFWAERLRAERAERQGPPTETIRGVTVNVPQDLPMVFQHQVAVLRASEDQEAFQQLLAGLFGANVLGAWIAAGMGEREFQVILAWAAANGAGKETSFQQAYEQVMAREGKAPSSTETSAASGSTGGRSRRTSRANTSSRRSK